jgi:hypothetical protein
MHIIVMDALPLELLIKITSYDWMAHANLALACPRFCKWAAQAEAIAMFMRQFMTINDGGWYMLLGLKYRHSWFDYPVHDCDGRRTWMRREWISDEWLITRSNLVVLTMIIPVLTLWRLIIKNHRYTMKYVIHLAILMINYARITILMEKYT